MIPYKVLVTHHVLSLPRPRAQDKARIISFLERLSDDPFQKGDYEEKDEVGRPVQIKIIGPYALAYLADHSEREVKILQIEKADKR